MCDKINDKYMSFVINPNYTYIVLGILSQTFVATSKYFIKECGFISPIIMYTAPYTVY